MNRISRDFHPSVASAVDRLKRLEVPVLSFAQTVFWDDPMKAILLRALREQGAPNRFIAGIHDTDYFSKLSHVPAGEGRFCVVSRNDGSTKELWAATAETAAFFGSETPTPVHKLLEHGVKLSRLKSRIPEGSSPKSDIDHLTESWGWRAVAFRGEHAPVAHDVQMAQVYPSIHTVVEWGIEQTLSMIHWESKHNPSDWQEAANRLRQLLLAESDRHATGNLTEFYSAVMPQIYRLLLSKSGASDDPAESLGISACTGYFRFSETTCFLPRFRIVNCFLDPALRPVLAEEYDRAVAGSGIYELDRFGAGALPFDLVVPGEGRGTLLIAGERCVARFADREVVISQGTPLTDAAALAKVIEARFGDDCALLGKALALPVMFACEGVMLLNEGASVYIPRTQRWVRAVRARLHGGSGGLTSPKCLDLPLYPLLRLRYQTWDSLQVLDLEFHLPQHLQDTFCHRTNPYPAKEFARRWREVLNEQRQQLEALSQIRGTRDLLPFLAQDSTCGPSEKWNAVLEKYLTLMNSVHETAAQLDDLSRRIEGLKKQREECEASIAELERHSGELRRRMLGDSTLSESQREELTASRKSLLDQISATRSHIRQLEAERKQLGAQANQLRLSSEYQAKKQQMHDIELEAEQQRLRLVRNALLTQGLEAANRRPCAWWFPVVDPSMRWWEEVTRTTEMYFEEW